jgi:hypothetical protein
MVHFLAGIKDFSLLWNVQLGSGALPASYSVDSGLWFHWVESGWGMKVTIFI